MDKRKLAKVPIETATEDMLKISTGLKEEYMVTASLIDDNKILLLNFYEVSKLKKGKTEAAFRTFLSKEDYITQDLKTSKIKWKTASFENMDGFCLVKGYWNEASRATNKWEHTPMKYSALEVMARNIPTVALRYEDAMGIYLKFPKLEWLCKMGLNQLTKDVVRHYNYGSTVGKINYKAGTIYGILGLNKVNTRTLQAIDGNNYELRLLQVAQSLGIQMKPEQLKEFYDTFECNTELLKAKNRKVSLHKLCRYIEKESERYPVGERACMWSYSYNRYRERTDPRIERKRNMAHDWLEYLGWCKELKYDTSNMFIYMPNNFKKVHDRVAGEYKALQDKKSAEEKRRREAAAKRELEQTEKAMAEIFEKNNGTDAFSIKGKGLILVVPKSGDEIRAEGEALHHCVGGYVQRVARGETNIFFVRKADEPDKSYFTMEWNHNKVIQCRGKGNCGMPPEVKAFVKVFEQKMQEAVKKDDKQQKRRCG